MEKDVIEPAYKLFNFVFNLGDNKPGNLPFGNDCPENEAKRIQTAAHHIIEDCSIILLAIELIKYDIKGD